MRNLTVLFLILTLNSCVSQIKTNNTTIQKHYFYIDRTQPKMKVYGKKEELRHTVIIEIPAYNIEDDSAVLENIMAASKTESNNAVFFNNAKYPISKIDSILKSNTETDYSLIVKIDMLGRQRMLFLIPKLK